MTSASLRYRPPAELFPCLPGEAGGHHKQDIVDARGRLEGRNRVLHQWLASEDLQLLWQPAAEPLAGPAGQHDRDRPHEGTLPGGPPVADTAAAGCTYRAGAVGAHAGGESRMYSR